ncbi:methylated-DNA--[protein]-cysteine S-methyltransferase [Actinomadura sp. NEAU-AAG7]|uniref:methylated-DNA--[protein]-cysteine S-methyltransferase n=1 Tax=Actinomadura sp. NEAU-AAG7 TaxID=2839640 RepID=UPI001BE4C85E|nr:methylated-DNA--[protein]-cysteine S-methyltransferase [Actinomadura sp. NEAU-AAG7]MBT2207480.1 methylated-DNA--[protein]-cysteine S-methyltransferase [Actinomadura sp. NEAU-AAG7]
MPIALAHRSHLVLDSPVGPLTLVATGGALSGLYMEHQAYRPAEEVFGRPAADPGTAPFGAAAEQLAAYFKGRLTSFDLPLLLHGTPFQRRVWAALRRIPYGGTVTYGRLAALIGSPTASRAVGLANGRNPIGVIVPCHRVVGSSGGLIGYGGGLDRKRFLLDHEYGTLAGSAAAVEPEGLCLSW